MEIANCKIEMQRRAQMILRSMVDMGVVVRVGVGKGTKYFLAEK